MSISVVLQLLDAFCDFLLHFNGPLRGACASRLFSTIYKMDISPLVCGRCLPLRPHYMEGPV